MASAAQAQGLPLLYNELMPLSTKDHLGWKFRPFDSLDIVKNVHAVPVTTDEFAAALRFYPIVFSSGPDPVPLALMGLNEGVNVYVDEAGKLNPSNTYLPAYLRRYPFMLARLNPNVDEMSLCFDPSADRVGDFEDGQPLFDGDQPAQVTKDVLAFCEQFEISAQRTGVFMAELKESGLLEEGEVTIQHQNVAQPYNYRGFQMVNEERMRDLRGDQLRKMSQSGALLLIHAHLFSLNLMSEIFNRQMEQGKVPPQVQLSNG